MKLKIKIISVGHGSNGYYPADVLAKYGPSAFPSGTKILNTHINNNSRSPARLGQGVSGDDLVGQLLEDAYFSNDENGDLDGAGLYAEVEIFRDYADKWGKDKIKSMEFSIFAFVSWVDGESPDGIETRIASSMMHTRMNSVDAVVFGGAGGKTIDIVSESMSWCESNDFRGVRFFPMDADIVVSELLVTDRDSMNKNIDDKDEEIKKLKMQLAECCDSKKNLMAQQAVIEALMGVRFIGDEARDDTIKKLVEGVAFSDDGQVDSEKLRRDSSPYTGGESVYVVVESSDEPAPDEKTAENRDVQYIPAAEKGNASKTNPSDIYSQFSGARKELVF